MTYRAESLADYGLGGVDCPLCGNRGQVIRKGPGLLELHILECSCMARRRYLRTLRLAGLEDMAGRYTLDAFVTDTQQRRRVKDAAGRFLRAETGWFFIAGQSGSGKTHLCTAICNGLVERGLDLEFMSWVPASTELKSISMDRDRYEARLKKLRTVSVLYLDDFFKGKVSEADVKLAFEILDGRYGNSRLRTVISSELTPNDILGIDEAVGGRILERSRGYVVQAPPENWRLRGGPAGRNEGGSET